MYTIYKKNWSNCSLTEVVWGHIYFRGPRGYTIITCDCAVADDAVMPIRASSS